MQQTGAGIFEGYVGIRLTEGQIVNDIIFASILCLFVCFSIIYRYNFRLFLKMLQDLYYVKERQSLFLLSSNNEVFFHNFMTFQTLALCSISLFSIAQIKGYIENFTEEITLTIALALFLILLSYHLLKQFLYFCICLTFFDKSKYKIWKSNYNAIIGSWGVLLYIPALWLAFVESYSEIPIWLFIILFILSRLVIIYKIIRIFHIKGNDILYLILYLCAQEILPLVFLYEGLVYLYNLIEASTLWH